MLAANVCLGVLLFGFVLGILVSIIVVIPQFLYQIPYHAWVGYTDANSVYPVIKDCSFFRDTINATKLYKHWIFHSRLDF